MNYQEILNVLKEKVGNVKEFAYEDYDKSELGLGDIQEVSQYGGEGQGNTWYSVKHFVDHDIYVRVDGYHSSYDGVDFYDGWECCSEVRPVEKVIIEYV